MAKVGIKSLTWAVYSSGGDGSAISYTGGTMKDDYMVRGELTRDNSDEKEHADNHLIDVDNAPTAVHLALELANMDSDMMNPFCGLTGGSTTGEYSLTEDGAPYIGCGYVLCNRFKGAVTYEAIWVHKIKFSQDSLAADTKAENVTFGHENVSGDAVGVILSSGGKVTFYDHVKGLTTEAAAQAWLRTKAGITTGG